MDDGSVATPLPPDLIETESDSAIVTPKSPMAFEREQEARIKKIRQSKGQDL